MYTQKMISILRQNSQLQNKKLQCFICDFSYILVTFLIFIRKSEFYRLKCFGVMCVWLILNPLAKFFWFLIKANNMKIHIIRQQSVLMHAVRIFVSHFWRRLLCVCQTKRTGQKNVYACIYALCIRCSVCRWWYV